MGLTRVGVVAAVLSNLPGREHQEDKVGPRLFPMARREGGMEVVDDPYQRAVTVRESLRSS